MLGSVRLECAQVSFGIPSVLPLLVKNDVQARSYWEALGPGPTWSLNWFSIGVKYRAGKTFYHLTHGSHSALAQFKNYIK